MYRIGVNGALTCSLAGQTFEVQLVDDTPAAPHPLVRAFARAAAGE